MEGAPIPSLYPPFPANPVVMNVVSQFTVYDSVGGFGGTQTLAILCVPLDQPPRREGQAGRSGNPRVTMGAGGANSAQCHQQLPILGMKHTGAQELGYRP